MRTRLEPPVAEDELRRAYEMHRLALVRMCALLVGDRATAEDIVQDVFVRARGRLGGMADAETYAYLRRATVNGWKNHLRHRAAEERATARFGDRTDDRPSADLEERDAVWTAISKLPSKQRAVLVLRYYEDLADGDIARLLGCRRVTVRTQAKRALEKMRETVER